jgi:hypothetical protein
MSLARAKANAAIAYAIISETDNFRHVVSLRLLKELMIGHLNILQD